MDLKIIQKRCFKIKIKKVYASEIAKLDGDFCVGGGAGNNPMVGMTVACAVAVNEALNK